jgi:hypothetical protein
MTLAPRTRFAPGEDLTFGSVAGIQIDRIKVKNPLSFCRSTDQRQEPGLLLEGLELFKYLRPDQKIETKKGANHGSR